MPPILSDSLLTTVTQMGVQGFPTLKLIKPSKQPGKKGHVEDYNGPRTAKGITDAVTDKITNYVIRLKSLADYEKFQAKTPDRPKGLVFSEKGLIPSFVKTLAIDFLGGVDFGYVRSGDKDLVDEFRVESFPTILLLPGDGGESVQFEGEISKAKLVEFFAQVTAPHPDAMPLSTSKESSSGERSKSKSSNTKSAKATPKAAEETLEPDSYPQHPKESPDPDVSSDQPKPVQVPLKAPPAKITKLEDPEALQKACLHTGSSTCLVAVIPDEETGEMNHVLGDLGDIAGKHAQRGTKLFPIYSVPSSNPEYKALADALKLADASEYTQLVAVNAKRGWWSLYDGTDVESWIDGIRLGDFAKKSLPDGLVKELQVEPVVAKEEKLEGEKPKQEEWEHVDL